MKYAQFRSKQILLFQITEQTTFYAKPYRDRKKGIKIILLTFHSIISCKTYSSQRLSCLSRFRYVVLATKMVTFFLLWRCDPTRVMASSFLRFLDHTQRRSTVGRTPLD